MTGTSCPCKLRCRRQTRSEVFGNVQDYFGTSGSHVHFNAFRTARVGHSQAGGGESEVSVKVQVRIGVFVKDELVQEQSMQVGVPVCREGAVAVAEMHLIPGSQMGDVMR